MSSDLKKFLFILFSFCFALSWQITSIKVLVRPVNINYLLFVCFYLSYIKDDMNPSPLFVFFFGILNDIATSSPLFETSTRLLLICTILHFYIKPLGFLQSFSFNGIALFCVIILNYIIETIFQFFFIKSGTPIAQVSLFNQIFWTLFFYIFAVPVLDFIEFTLLKKTGFHSKSK